MPSLLFYAIFVLFFILVAVPFFVVVDTFVNEICDSGVWSSMSGSETN